MQHTQANATPVRPLRRDTDQQTLVIGGTGKTGRKVADRLVQLGWPVRIGSRTGNPGFDWLDQATWKPALVGVDAVYLTFQPDLAIPGASDIIRSFSGAAVESGVRKIVLLSGRGEEEAQLCERVVAESGIAEWTVVRASWFSQNFSEGAFAEFINAGHLALPAGNVGTPFVDTDDIADVAVAALTEDGHNGQIYDVTGPRTLTFAQAVAEIAAATGRDIVYEQIPVDDFRAGLKEAGLPDDVCWLLGYLFTEVLVESNAGVTDGVERALGRKATDFSEYIHKAIANGAWN